MKKILIAGAVSTALMSTAAFGQATDSTSFDVTANVVDTCLIEEAADVSFGTITLENSNIPGPDSLTLNNGSQEAGSQNIWVSCNYAAKITASSLNDGLLNAAGASLVANDPNDFTNVIHYRVRLTHANAPLLELSTNLGGNSKSVTALGAFHDDATLRVYLDADGTPKRPVAGNYTDTATITLSPV